jgi:ubiquinone/menaquinone biosynthesis C-methylase UbiE
MLGLAVAMICLASPGCATAQRATPASAFPAPDRPVAGIATCEYSDERTRDRLGEADRVMDRLGVKPGLRVADLGAGRGYYTVRFVRRLGPGAVVYAEDVTPRYLSELASRLQKEGIEGVTLVLGDPRNPKLPPGAVDVALLSHMYHEIENPFAFLYHLHAALAPGGRVAIIDNDKPTKNHGTPPALLSCELAAVGYRQVDFLSLEPADGYLAVFVSDTLPAISEIRACPQ